MFLEHINRLSLVRNKIKLLFHSQWGASFHPQPLSQKAAQGRNLCREGWGRSQSCTSSSAAFSPLIYTLDEQCPSRSTLAGPRNCLCLWRRAGIAAPSLLLVGTAAETAAGPCHCWLCVRLRGLQALSLQLQGFTLSCQQLSGGFAH